MGGANVGSQGAAELEQRRADAALSQLLAARQEQGAGYHQNGKKLARARIAMRVLEHSLQGELSSVKEVLAQLHHKPAGTTTLHEGDAAWQRRTMQRGALQVCKFTCASVYMTCNTCNMYTSTYICVLIHNLDPCTGTNTSMNVHVCTYIHVYIYIYIYIFMVYIYTYIYVHTCTYSSCIYIFNTCICAYTQIYLYMYTYENIYAYIYIHTYMNV